MFKMWLKIGNIFKISPIERFEHDLRHLFPVSFGVQWGFGEEDGVFLWSNSELIVESVMPDFLHVVPVGDNAVFDGVLQSQDSSLGLSLISDI